MTVLLSMFILLIYYANLVLVASITTLIFMPAVVFNVRLQRNLSKTILVAKMNG
jgi:hypothetical protein